MIAGQITPAIMQEALRQTPNHKAAGPDGVPRLIFRMDSQESHATGIPRGTPPLILGPGQNWDHASNMAEKPYHPPLQERGSDTVGQLQAHHIGQRYIQALD
jgi:hypothetical protein